MKLNKMLSYCKKAKRIHIYSHENGIKYLSDGRAFMRLWNFSSIDSNNVMEFIGVSEDAQDDYIICRDNYFPFETHINNTDPIQKIERVPMTIEFPEAMVPFKTSKGLLLIDSERLDIFENPKIYDYYISYLMPPAVLVAYNDDVYGAVFPVRRDFEQLYTQLNSMANEAKKAYLNDFNNTGHQISIGELGVL